MCENLCVCIWCKSVCGGPPKKSERGPSWTVQETIREEEGPPTTRKTCGVVGNILPLKFLTALLIHPLRPSSDSGDKDSSVEVPPNISTGDWTTRLQSTPTTSGWRGRTPSPTRLLRVLPSSCSFLPVITSDTEVLLPSPRPPTTSPRTYVYERSSCPHPY